MIKADLWIFTGKLTKADSILYMFIGKMTKTEFQGMYSQLFPEGDAETFSEHVFNAYDGDGDGFIDFRLDYYPHLLTIC